jgi:hypothetical protein
MDWELYEQRKAEIQTQNLPPDEYEKAIRELVNTIELETEDVS